MYLIVNTDALYGAYTMAVLQTLHISKGLGVISVLTPTCQPIPTLPKLRTCFTTDVCHLRNNLTRKMRHVTILPLCGLKRSWTTPLFWQEQGKQKTIYAYPFNSNNSALLFKRKLADPKVASLSGQLKYRLAKVSSSLYSIC